MVHCRSLLNLLLYLSLAYSLFNMEVETGNQCSRSTSALLKEDIGNAKAKLNSVFKCLKDITENARLMVATNEDIVAVRKHYCDWMCLYEDYMNTHEYYCSFLSVDERATYYDEYYDERKIYFANFKSSIQEWFMKAEDVTSSKGSRSNKSKSSCHSSRYSAISSLKFKEDQNKVELAAQFEALKQQKEIDAAKLDLEAAKLDLEFPEKELALVMKINISNGKAKLFDEYNKTCNKSSENNIDGRKSSNVSVSDKHVPVCDEPLTSVNADADENTTEKPNLRTSTLPHNQHMSTRQDFLRVRNYSTPSTGYNDVIIPEQASRYMPNATHDPPDACIPHQNQPEGALNTMLRQIRKPRSNIKPFSGNVLEYQRFIRQFNSAVVANCESMEEKLNFLDQFTTGDANKIV
ncbi:uncharacterized protein LOC126825402 isoform X1 [Patella vulgata]|uniref:uncharacterized protein LOC126825402 isoform X1 n=1 Tax=Patella vulgata TaxID=6465 RepID=UPI0021802F0A|nr:uncharacterized protein LOC126825402 isoform X1 [Patella vulgata]